jgi:hypothetical protein
MALRIREKTATDAAACLELLMRVHAPGGGAFPPLRRAPLAGSRRRRGGSRPRTRVAQPSVKRAGCGSSDAPAQLITKLDGGNDASAPVARPDSRLRHRIEIGFQPSDPTRATRMSSSSSATRP